VIQYAARALQLAEELFEAAIQAEFLSRLELAKSNLQEYGDGRWIFEKFVQPAEVTLQKVGAHYAISSLFEKYEQSTQVYCYEVSREEFQLLQEGKAKLALGRVGITSTITEESDVISFGVLHLGDQNVYGGIRRFGGEQAYHSMIGETAEEFRRGDIPELIRAVDRNFGSGTFTLRYLFRDEQRRIVSSILGNATADASALYRSFYSQYGTLIRFVADLGIPLSPEFQMAVDFTLHEELIAALSCDQADHQKIRLLFEQFKHAGIQVHRVALEFAFRQTLERAAQRFRLDPGNLEQLQALERTVDICALLPFEINLWAVQNIYFEVTKAAAARFADRAKAGDSQAQLWLATAASVGERLYVNPNRLAAKVTA
jgi:hypothetical protein